MTTSLPAADRSAAADPTAAGELLDAVEAALLDRRELVSEAQAYALADLAPAADDDAVLGRMLDLAHRVRLAWCGDAVSLESILSRGLRVLLAGERVHDAGQAAAVPVA